MKKIKIVNNKPIYYLLDSTQSFLYLYCQNAKSEIDFKESLIEINKEDFESTTFNIIISNFNKDDEVTSEINKDISIADLIKEYKKGVEIDDFKIVKAVIKTTKDIGLNIEKESYNFTTHEFNKFFKADKFIKAKEKNIFSKKYEKEIEEKELFKIFKKECPNVFILIKNLFFKEEERIMDNFLNYLSAISYSDDNQDVIYLFKGTSEEKQGQGAGKGTLKFFLNEVLGGLVTETSNERYRNNFNINYFNKKIIILDEFDFNNKGYGFIKNLTGSNILTIEKKGKDTINVKNTASWLIFTNQYEIPKNFGVIKEDRRLNIINVNPETESLAKIIHRKYKKATHMESMKYYRDKLVKEVDKFINILGLYDNKYLKPSELKTNAHLEYFKDKKSVNIEEFELDKLYLQHYYKKLKELLLPSNNNPYISLMFKYNSLDYTFLTLICDSLSKLYNFKFQKSSLFYWNLLKSNGERNKLKLFKAELRENKTYKRLKREVLLVKKLTKEEEKNLKFELRELLNLKK